MHRGIGPPDATRDRDSPPLPPPPRDQTNKLKTQLSRLLWMQVVTDVVLTRRSCGDVVPVTVSVSNGCCRNDSVLVCRKWPHLSRAVHILFRLISQQACYSTYTRFTLFNRNKKNINNGSVTIKESESTSDTTPIYS